MITDMKSQKSTHKIDLKIISLALLCPLLISGCGKKADTSYMGQGMSAIEALDYNAALSAFSSAIDSGEDIQLSKRGEGIALMGLARYDEAVDSFEESLHNGTWRIGSLERDTNYYLAAAFEKKGDYKDAVEVYDAITGMWPKEKLAYVLRGTAKLKMGEFDSADLDFAKALEFDPDDYDTLIDIYRELDAAGHTSAGETYLSNALSANEDGMSGYDRGRIYYYLKRYDEARNSLEAVRDTGGDAILYLGLAYEALGDYNYATSVYQGFISARAGDARIYNQLGVCEMQMGAYQDAYDHFSQGLTLEDSSCQQSLMSNQISACEHMGDFSRAKSLMAEYLRMYPDDAYAAREQKFLSTR